MVNIAHVIDAIITLRDQFSATLKNVNANITDFQKKANYMGRDISKVGRSLESTGAGLTAALTMPLVGVGAAAVKAGMDFEAQMSSIKAVSGSTGVEMKQLSDLALKAGADTAFSAKDAARGIEELIKAGVSVKDILNGGLMGALNLATAGELELGEAAEIASTALNAFKADNLTVSSAANILAGAANASATDVRELKFGLSSVAAVASSVGMSFNDTSTALAVFAQNGLKGSDAGTSLKTMLMNLQPSTDKQVALFKQLNLVTENGSSKFFTAQGHLKSLSEISEILNNSMKGLTDAQRLQAMETLFGSDAIRAANILYKENSKGVTDMKAAMSKVTAEQVAAEKLNNFKGSLEQLKGSLETAGITLAQTFLPHLKEMVDNLTILTNRFSQLNPRTQEVIIKFAMFAATAGPAIWIIGSLTSSIGHTTTSIARLTKDIQKAGGIMAWLKTPGNLVVIALTAIIAIAILLYIHWDKISKIAQELRDKFVELKDKAISKVKEEFQNLVNKVKEIKDKLIEFKDGAVKKTIEKFDDFKKTLKDNQTEIKVTASILGTIFGPALLITGTKAAIAGGQIAAHFIASVVKTGAAAVANGAKVTASFVASMVKTGTSAVVNGAKVTASFIASMVKAGAEAVIAGAKITAGFIASLIKTAAQATKTALVITGQLIVAVAKYALEGWKVVVSVGAQTIAISANAIALGAQKIALFASAAATKAATAAQWLFNAALSANPIVLVIAGVIALGIVIYELVKHWDQVKEAVSQAWEKFRNNPIGQFIINTNPLLKILDEIYIHWNSITSAIQNAWNWLTTWNGTKAQDKAVTFTQTRIDDTRTISEKASERTGKNALGTSYWRGGETWVGENGPEKVWIPSGSKVIDHRNSMNSNGKSITIAKLANQIIIREDADIDKLATALAKKLILAEANII
ncbi:phage tail tape measure protein [Clostridium magnum]|uniref:Phage-related minor tail protein n=1 Tax=Clostridium magnum DSM 2767 TaxID=1121326 RepID=A0A162UWZ6_9CLOT|nr:phage tail tape measure protein [Clostridium magnum]KZL94370.1 phage-related minor tail protein [Clostridium magnum DSM 2767]SHJ49982.1 phage tail tape measure protein, TP901 family, core region [Clostridium magnum DSM 2767]